MVPDPPDDAVPADLRSPCARSDTWGAPRPRPARDDRGRGATAVEYALLVALIIGAIAGLVATVGRQVFDMYNTVPSF